MNTSADWTLRLARPRHCPAMARIAAGVQGFETLNEAQIAAMVSRRRSLFVTVGEQPAGFLLARGERRELHIGTLVVAEPFRRCGIAGGLIRAAIIDAENGGFDAVTAVISGSGDHEGGAEGLAGETMSLATRLGFVQVMDEQAHPRLAEIVTEKRGAEGSASPVAMIRFL